MDATDLRRSEEQDIRPCVGDEGIGSRLVTQVEIGTLTETQVEILSGVEEGQTVALSGPTELVVHRTGEAPEVPRTVN